MRPMRYGSNQSVESKLESKIKNLLLMIPCCLLSFSLGLLPGCGPGGTALTIAYLLQKEDKKKEKHKWYIETVDWEGDTGWHPKLDIDKTNRPHIIYFSNSSGELKYAYRQDQDMWKILIVDTNSMGSSSIALDSENKPHIAYITQEGVKYAIYNGTSWIVNMVDPDTSLNDISLALDKHNLPHICYVDAQYNLRYFHFNGIEWISEILDSDVGIFLDMKLDADDHPHIVYYKRGTDEIKHVYGFPWKRETIDFSGRWPSLTIDKNNNIHICYYDTNTQILKYGFFDSKSGWMLEELSSFSDLYPEAHSIDVDKNGNPHIVVIHEGTLKYFVKKEPLWIYSVLTTGLGNTIEGIEIKLDEFNRSHIVYYNGNYLTGDLNYAFRK